MHTHDSVDNTFFQRLGLAIPLLLSEPLEFKYSEDCFQRLLISIPRVRSAGNVSLQIDN